MSGRRGRRIKRRQRGERGMEKWRRGYRRKRISRPGHPTEWRGSIGHTIQNVEGVDMVPQRCSIYSHRILFGQPIRREFKIDSSGSLLSSHELRQRPRNPVRRAHAPSGCRQRRRTIERNQAILAQLGLKPQSSGQGLDGCAGFPPPPGLGSGSPPLPDPLPTMDIRFPALDGRPVAASRVALGASPSEQQPGHAPL